jgi:hypothetical protein
MKDTQKAIQFIVLATSCKSDVFCISSKDQLRMDWANKFFYEMKKRGIKLLIDNDADFTVKKIHDSIIINKIANEVLILNSSFIQEIFFAYYLAKHSCATDIVFPNIHNIEKCI